MTPTLADMRDHAAASFRWRRLKKSLTQAEYAALPDVDRKGWRWQPCPDAVAELVEKEKAWRP